MNIGCLGLSANPPHKGHIDVARVLLKSGCFFDEIWLIPVYKHSFDEKSDMAPWKHRSAMCRLLQEPSIRVCEVEREREGISYTIDTLAHLRSKYPQHSFAWCVGSDIVTSGSYRNWHRWEELKEREKICVVERPGYILTAEMPDCF